MRVGVVQLCSGTDVAKNIETTSHLITQAAADGARFIATPEMTHLLEKDKQSLFKSIREEREDLGVSAFASLAKELDVYLLIGSLAVKAGDKVANRSYVFGPNSEIVAKYDKIHLFDAQVSDTESYRESATYIGGKTPQLVTVDNAQIGLSICYDLRFANLYRHYTKAGAQILTVPAAFTVPTGQAHWDVLLRARAIETSSFVIAPAQGGHHQDGRKTYGHSKVINPWGEVTAEIDHDRPDFCCVDIDVSEVDKARCRIPAWNSEQNW